MDAATLQRRVLDLLSMFAWHDGVVEQLCGLGQPGRYAIVSRSVRDDCDHWLDGFADDLTEATRIIADIDDEWTLVGLFDLSGQPGDPITCVPVHIRYEAGGSHTTRPIGLPEGALAGGGTHDVGWAEGVFNETEE